MAQYSAIAKIWWKKIKSGDVIFANCPTKLQAAVIEWAKLSVANGEITEAEYEKLIGTAYTAE